MTRWRRWLAAVLAALAGAAGPARAGTWTDCAGTDLPDQTSVQARTVDPGERLCYVETANEDSPAFFVTSAAVVCLDPDPTTEGVANAQGTPRFCHLGSKPTTSPQNRCFKTRDTPLTGLQGSVETQAACMGIQLPGAYYIDHEASAAGVEATWSITGVF